MPQNITKISSCLAIATLPTIGLSLSASAATITYTDRSTFLNNISATYLETFNSLTTASNPQSFANNGFGYAVSATGGLNVDTDTAGSRFLGANTAGANIVVNFANNNITAVGGFFFSSDLSNNFTADAIQLTLNNGSRIDIAPSATKSFRGFATDDGSRITSLTFAGGSSQFNTFGGFDDFYVGTANIAPTPVPEPSQILTYIILGSLIIWKKATRHQQ